MKKILLLLTLMVGFQARAFEFDGIDLNDDAQRVTRAISAKNYINDAQRGCLKGLCQGTEIYLSFNFEDVSTPNKIGQLFVDIPMQSAGAYESCVVLFNVIYHQVEQTGAGVVYSCDDDGTTVLLEKTGEGVRLTYNTPYYYKKGKK